LNKQLKKRKYKLWRIPRNLEHFSAAAAAGATAMVGATSSTCTHENHTLLRCYLRCTRDHRSHPFCWSLGCGYKIIICFIRTETAVADSPIVACVTDASRDYRTHDNIILSSLRGGEKNNNIITSRKDRRDEKNLQSLQIAPVPYLKRTRFGLVHAHSNHHCERCTYKRDDRI